jgi:acetyl esterase
MAVAQMARDRGTPRIALQAIAYGTALMRVSNLEFADLPVLAARDCEWFWQMYVSADGDRLDPRCCPLLAPDLSGLPPAFVMTAENDPTRYDTEAYAHRLAAAGVHTTLKRYPGIFHGFLSMTAALERAREAMDDLGGVVRARLGQHAETAEPRS